MIHIIRPIDAEDFCKNQCIHKGNCSKKDRKYCSIEKQPTLSKEELKKYIDETQK